MTTVYVPEARPKFEIGTGRPKKYLTPDGRKCISVTNVCGQWGEKHGLYRYFFGLGVDDGRRHEKGEATLGFDRSGVEARDIGTAVHDAIMATIIQGKPVPPRRFGNLKQDNEASNAYANFLEFWDESGLEPESVEVSIVNGEHAVAGTHDLVARSRKKKRIVTDWKTSKDFWPANLIQLAAYGWLWEEDLRDPVDGYCLALFPKEGKGSSKWYSAAQMAPARMQWLRLVEATKEDGILKDLLERGGPLTLDDREELDVLVGEVNKVFALPGLPDGERKKGTKR